MSKITKERLFEILNARHLNNPYSKLASIPSFNNFKDINIATKRVKQAILSGEKITIVTQNKMIVILNLKRFVELKLLGIFVLQ